MFTGLVTFIGTIDSARRRGAGLTVAVAHQLAGGPIGPGESICVDGCCLTAATAEPGRFAADISPETLKRTGGASRWRAGRRVHLERALAMGDRLGGHFVQGHADGLVRVLGRRRRAGDFVDLRLETPRQARLLAVEKASVALDGVSLTIARCGPNWFEVALAPATLAGTNLGSRRAGDRLIVEWDVLVKAAVGAARG